MFCNCPWAEGPLTTVADGSTLTLAGLFLGCAKMLNGGRARVTAGLKRKGNKLYLSWIVCMPHLTTKAVSSVTHLIAAIKF